MKKRRNSRIDTDDEAPATTQEIGRHRKVKFVAAPENDSPRLSVSERRKVTAGTDMDPKTSEYAFFKKLKNDASLRFYAHPLKKDASLSSKKPRSSDYSRERTGSVRVASKAFNSSKIIEDMSSVKTDSFVSPSGGTWLKSGNQYANGEIFSRKREKLRQCIADVLIPDIEKLSSKGLGTVALLIVDVFVIFLYREYKFCRCDIVSMLLSRLFPMSIEENKSEDPNRGKVENDTRYDLLDSSESDFEFKEHYQIRKRRLLELEPSSYFSDPLLSPMFLKSDETTTPHAEFPTNHSYNFQPLYSIAEPECKFRGSPSFSATTKSDITLGSLSNEVANETTYGLLDSQELDVKFTEHRQIPRRDLLELESSSSFSDHLLSPMFLPSPEFIAPCAEIAAYSHKFQPLFRITENESKLDETTIFIDKNYVTNGFLSDEKKHETFTLNHFKELGKLERQPISLLLEKDYDCTTNKVNLPINYKHINPDMPPALSILGHGEEQMLNNALAQYHFSPLPFLLDKPHDFNSRLDPGLLNYQEFSFGKSVHEDMDTNCNHTALSLSHYKHQFKLSENCENDMTCVDPDSKYLSPYQQWVRRTVSNDHHETEPWLLSPTLDECQRLLPLTSSHTSYLSSNSRSLLLPQREANMSYPFQIVDNYESEMELGNQGEEVLYHFRKDFIEMYDASFLRMSVQRDIGCQFSVDENDYINEQEQTHKMLV
ncbi:uncharacterized protein LOC130720868 isoform X3 [Lotus japonicus]|uniref:uncharacterized protein LOC130720868 isoform X3 n=1 Tax=Lotus japonicus TaxID=34305 RepID=UPI0025835DA5|nr:uncharacterized protein LOC130720868 isoform X3 [Lotus japonicus]